MGKDPLLFLTQRLILVSAITISAAFQRIYLCLHHFLLSIAETLLFFF